MPKPFPELALRAFDVRPLSHSRVVNAPNGAMGATRRYTRRGMERSVLVVDDDASLRLLCRVNLELEGCRVLEAASVAEAVELIARERVDVALLDRNVGSRSGLELVPALRALERPVRIFVLSGDSRLTAEERALVDGVLGKPFSLPELAAAVR